ncbi:MAG: LysR family transcriptional regulator [Clostridiales bacterium]|nr:LysR family transcriptional regulator [Clostridiales bacterium]
MDFSLAPITIQQIIVFLRVAEYGGFAKASGYLNMTQSAVSKSIARLERDLGITLFQRTTREIHLTEAGQILYEEWREQIRELHNSYIKAASIQNQEYKQLRIGILNTARPELYLWEIEETFSKRYPDIKLDLASAYMTDLEEDLAAGNYDLIMIPDFERYIIESMGLCWKWAACSHANVMMNRSHPLASHPTLKMTDLLYESFATLEQRQRPTHREDLEERMAPYHVKPTIVPGYRNAYEIKYLFRKQENAILFIDEYFDCPDNPDLVKIPVVDQMNGIICAWNPNNQKPQLQKFIKVLRPARTKAPDRV